MALASKFGADRLEYYKSMIKIGDAQKVKGDYRDMAEFKAQATIKRANPIIIEDIMKAAGTGHITP